MRGEEFKLFCGQLDALAFLPIDDILAGKAQGMDQLEVTLPQSDCTISLSLV